MIEQGWPRWKSRRSRVRPGRRSRRPAPIWSTLSEQIHDHPELCFEETYAAERVAETLAAGGFAVETGAYELPTAFEAKAGSGPLSIVICAEYDALPGIGHACGHNLIAASAVGAGLALAGLADDLGLTVTVLGTPAEEGGGGKVFLLERGAFNDAHAAMMVHPWPEDLLEATCLAVDHMAIRYEGRDAHASASPEKGINAGDAFVVAQVAIGLIRQHLPPGNQVHGIVNKGGDAANIVPKEATGTWMIRARTIEDLAALRPRIEHCFEAGALATGVDPRDRRPLPHLLPLRGRSRAAGRLAGQRRGTGPPLPARRSPPGPPHHLHRHGQRLSGPPHHPSHDRRSTPRGPSTTNRSSPPPASVPRPTGPSSTVLSGWPGRSSTPPPIRPCGIVSWPPLPRLPRPGPGPGDRHSDAR